MAKEEIKVLEFNFRELDGKDVYNSLDKLINYNIDIEEFKTKLRSIEIKDNKDIIKKIIKDDQDTNAIKFDYVGIIILDIKNKYNKNISCVIKCYPKYYKDNPNNKDFMRILEVVTKYKNKNRIDFYDIYHDDDKNYNKIEVVLHIIKDYLENGLYSNQHEIIEENGEGEILWDKTINENIAVIKDNKPYYLDFFTRNAIDNDDDYFRRLHEFVVSDCIRYLKNLKQYCDLFELFGVHCDELTDATIDDFGDIDYITYRIESEIRIQYITQKQDILRRLLAYINEEQNVSQNDVNYSLFGTGSFNLVWEDVCKSVFNDKSESVNKKINKPKWFINGNEKEIDDKYKVEDEKRTLRPDIIVEEDKDNGITVGKYFGIYDAKYYSVNIDGNKLGEQPGVGDIIKQYFYQISFKDYIKDKGFQYVQNVLLFPDFDPPKYTEFNGNSYVTMETLKQVINDDLKIGSGRIRVVWLDTKDMYKRYLNGEGVQITGNDILSFIPLDDDEIIK